MVFDISTTPINNALGAVAKAKNAIDHADKEHERLMDEMSFENVGRFGVEERERQIAMIHKERDETVNKCVAQVEFARMAFLQLIDEAVQPDGERLDLADIALLNAGAVTFEDIARMLVKHENNYTMVKAIEAYAERNDIANIDGKKLVFDGRMKEEGLREFGKLFFDKCVSACSLPYGYNAMFIANREAVNGLLQSCLV